MTEPMLSVIMSLSKMMISLVIMLVVNTVVMALLLYAAIDLKKTIQALIDRPVIIVQSDHPPVLSNTTRFNVSIRKDTEGKQP